jgi:tRNA A37 threonylcarbamoyladenosine dehydratase
VFVTVGAAGGKRLAQGVEIADLGQVTHDPLLAKLRYQLRRLPGAPAQGKPFGVACVFSREAVQAPPASCEGTSDGSLNCHGYGSLVTVTATFGLCAAGWAMEKISSLGEMPKKRRL